MAGLTTRTYIAGALILVFGVGIQLFGKARAAGFDEKYMEKAAPTKVGKFNFEENKETPGKSYKMDDRSYELLKPFGIVPRRYTDGMKTYEVLLISSNTKESFHDQDVCFPGQGMTPVGDTVHKVEMEGRGTVPVVVSKYITKEQQNLISAYIYRGPGGYHESPQDLAMAMLMNALTGARQSNNSNFYRFMPLFPDATEEETLAFIKAYMAEAAKTSKGFY